MTPAFETIPNTARVGLITYTPPFSAVCAIGRAPFYGTLEIEYQPASRLLEFESFEQWLRSIANEPSTVEDLCRLVFDALSAALGDIRLRVTVRAATTVHAPACATIERSGDAIQD